MLKKGSCENGYASVVITVDKRQGTSLVKALDKLAMLIRDMLFYKRRGFEKFLACFASEFSLILLLDIRFNSLGQLTTKNGQ